MSDVGGRVWGAVAKATHAMPNRDTVSYEEWLATGDALASEATGDILATIREALLSPETVEAASAAWGSAWRSTDAKMNDVNLLSVSITAALAAAGIGGQGDE